MTTEEYDNHPIRIGFGNLLGQIKTQEDLGLFMACFTMLLANDMEKRGSSYEVLRTPTTTMTITFTHENNLNCWVYET